MVLAYEESCNLLYKLLFNEWKPKPITLTWYQQGAVHLLDSSSTPSLPSMTPRGLSFVTPPLISSSNMANNDAQAAAALAAVIVAALPRPLAPSLALALATVIVKTHILFTLELDPPNYSTWHELFVTLVGKFGALSHIDGTPHQKIPMPRGWLSIVPFAP